MLYPTVRSCSSALLTRLIRQLSFTMVPVRLPFLMNNIFLKLQSDLCHAEEDCDDADAGWEAA